MSYHQTIYVLRLDKTSIFRQLQIEEALLRNDWRNVCILNHGSCEAVVMGISGRPERLLDADKLVSMNVPLIKRFSGGGTVFVDSDTLFVTFILDKKFLAFPLFPEPVMRWSGQFYQGLFSSLDSFSLRENDYVMGQRKFGGNAQYIRKGRCLHHTSFLWSFDPVKMSCLLQPEKAPMYRQGRSHDDFLCCLKDYSIGKEEFFQKLLKQLESLANVQEFPQEELQGLLDTPHRKSTRYMSYPNRVLAG